MGSAVVDSLACVAEGYEVVLTMTPLAECWPEEGAPVLLQVCDIWQCPPLRDYVIFGMASGNRFVTLDGERTIGKSLVKGWCRAIPGRYSSAPCSSALR